MSDARHADLIQAFNERSKAAGWEFTCGTAANFDHPELENALALWREKAAGRAMPDREEMTARVMKPFIRQMSILERVGSGKSARYRVRLHGSVLASYNGDRTGMFMDEVFSAASAASYAGIYDMVLELQRPLRVVSHYQEAPINYLSGESLIAPLAVAGSETPLILSVTYVQPRGAGSKP